jgi:Acyl-CoA dehydrogenase, N-terminal domain
MPARERVLQWHFHQSDHTAVQSGVGEQRVSAEIGDKLMEDGGAIGYQLPQELISLREQVSRIIHDEVIPAESRVDPDAAEILDDDYCAIAKKTQAAGMWCMGSPQQYGGGGLGMFDMWNRCASIGWVSITLEPAFLGGRRRQLFGPAPSSKSRVTQCQH